MRGLICSFAVLLLGVSIAMAEEINAKIVAVNGNKIVTVAKKKETKEYEATTDVRVTKMAKKGAKEALVDGLKADIFKNIDAKKGIQAKLITNDDGKVVEVVLGAAKKKKTN